MPTATSKGMYLHFKTLETENELTMDGGNLGPERILYYRELIARYGHHLALNWNLGEEINDASTAQKQAWSRSFYDNDPYHHHQVFATNSQVYVGYLATNATPSLNLTGVIGDFTVRWFNPFSGGGMQTGTVAQVTGGGTRSLGSPPPNSTKDWVVLVKLIPAADTTPPSVSITAPTNGASLFANLPLTVSATVTDNVAVALAELRVDGVLQPPAITHAPFDFTLTNLTLGGHTLAVTGQDTSANRATNSVTVTMVAPAQPLITLSSVGGIPIVLERAGIRCAPGD